MRAPATRCCIGCGGCFAGDDNDSHAYMRSSAGCWSAYGELLAREYQDPVLFARCHQQSVDAYAVQHRGGSEQRAVRSVWLHFAALDVVDRRGGTSEDALDELRRLATVTLPPLPPETPVFAITLADVVAAGADQHVEAVWE